MKTTILLLLIAVANIMTTFAQCDTTNTEFKVIVDKYEKIYKEIEPDTTKGPWTKNPEIGWAGDINIKMINKKISFDLVSVTMKNKEISFNTPQVTMRQKKMSFNIVETTMKNEIIGYKPEFKCCPPKTKMTPIITKIPVVKSVKKTFSTNIPEFKYQTTSFITKIPEFKKDRKEIILKLPEVTVITASSYARAQEKEANKIKDKYETLTTEQKKEITNTVISTFECQKKSITEQRTTVYTEFNNAISEVDKSVENTKSNGADPTNLTTEDGSNINLVQLKSELITQLDQALKTFDEALKQLIEKEKEVVESL